MAYLTLANIKKEYNVSRTETQTVLKEALRQENNILLGIFEDEFNS